MTTRTIKWIGDDGQLSAAVAIIGRFVAPGPSLDAITLSTPTIPENSPGGNLVSTINGAVGSTFTLTDDAGGRFAITGANLLAGLVATNFEAATSHSITIRETNAGYSNTGRLTTLAVSVTNVWEQPDLAALAFSSTVFTVGTPSSGTITGGTTGAALVATGMPSGLTVDVNARSWAWDGTGTDGTSTVTLTETLADSSNSPRASPVSITINPAGVEYGVLDFSLPANSGLMPLVFGV